MLAANYQKQCLQNTWGSLNLQKKVTSEHNLLAFTFAQKVVFETHLHFIEMLKIQYTEWYSRSTYKQYNCTQSGMTASVY